MIRADHRNLGDPSWIYGAVASAMTAILLAAALFALLALSGCVPAVAIEQAEQEAAITAGHVRDAELPIEARQVAQDAHDAWLEQYRSLTGEEVADEATLKPEERVE